MDVFERDEYAERHRRPFPRFRLWLFWVLATGIGFYLARLSVQGIDQMAHFGGPAFWAFWLVRGAVLGALVGAAQGLVLLRYTGRLGWLRWVLATAAGWAAHSLFLYPAGDWLVDRFAGLGAQGLVTAASLSGVVLGIAVGLPQSFVLRAYVNNSGLWVFLNACGAVLGRAVAALCLVAGVIGDAVTLAVVDITVTALITGILLAALLRTTYARVEIPAREPARGPAEVTMYAPGEGAIVAPGLTLTFREVELGPSSIAWRGTVENDNGEAVHFGPAGADFKIEDSTGKPYAVSSVTVDGEYISAQGNAAITVTGNILPYSPIPPGAAYLDLQYVRGRPGGWTFRRQL